jgi:hypothetical protein
MNPALTEESQVAHVPDNAREHEDASIWLEHVRWAWERQRGSYDELGRQAVAFLSLSGLLLALLANVRPSAHSAARGWISVAIWFALASAVLALCAVIPRRAHKLPATGLHEKWAEYNAAQHRGNLAAEFTEMLLENEVGPLAELQTDSRWRGALTVLSGVSATAAIALVVVAIAVR